MGLGEIIRKRREQQGFTQDQLAQQAGISKPYLSNIETGKAKNPPSDEVLRALERGLSFDPGQLTRLAHLVRTPIDVREEHELLEAEVNKLRNVVRDLLAQAPKKDLGGLDLDKLAAQLREKGGVGGLSAGVAVPVINKVAAGYPLHFTDLDYPASIANEYIRCPDLHDPQAFAARVAGDSMEPDYHEGDVVVFSPVISARNGDDCFIRFDVDASTTFKRFYKDDERTIRLQPLNNKYPAEIYSREQITGIWPAVFRIQRLRES
jgi:phage repressor protein C with HTH and peptisase S24 domain/DNA-binding XRE family transcriptional regulator